MKALFQSQPRRVSICGVQSTDQCIVDSELVVGGVRDVYSNFRSSQAGSSISHGRKLQDFGVMTPCALAGLRDLDASVPCETITAVRQVSIYGTHATEIEAARSPH